MRERLLSLERYSREYNLRFHNVPESTNEDCVQKVRDILSNQLDMEPEIENAHRVGPRNDDKPRVIICKFLYRPQRYKVIQKKRDLEDGICPTVIDAVIGMIFLYLYVKKQLKNCLKEHFSTIILLSINHRHTDSQMLHFLCVCVCVCVCVCMCFSFFLSFKYFSYIFHSL